MIPYDNKPHHPMQPIVMVDGVARFKQNRIIEYLFRTGKLSLNHLAEISKEQGFTKDDHMQIAQLLGYSVSGFGDLSYADPATVAEADAKVEDLIKPQD